MANASSPSLDSPITFLEGLDSTPRIIAVESIRDGQMAVYRRGDTGSLIREDIAFRPWLIAVSSEPWSSQRTPVEIETLHGEHPLRYLITFSNWTVFQDAVRTARENRETFFDLSSAVDQFLMYTGRTLFKGMVFNDLNRMQLDIETTGLDPSDPDTRLVMVAVRSHDGREIALTSATERELLVELNAVIQELNPDVIEGHNLFNFDLPFLEERSKRSSVQLNWGRDGSSLRIAQRQQRFKAGPLSLPFRSAYVHARHIVDTYQQIQRYDVGGKLTSYGLKAAVDGLGLTRPNREFVSGEEIKNVWNSDRDRLIRYALDDVRDVDVLSRLALPTEFYQTQLLPRTFQQVAVLGPGSKINDLMVRAYLCRRESVPLPGASRDYPGGHAELLETGVFSHVVKCDVESLYPSIMLAERITSDRDTLGAYLPMLGELTKRRLHAKGLSRSTTGQEQAMWEGLQGSFKVLINSFYGYLGFGAALFNDFHAAGKITLSGQRHIKSIVAALKESSGTPIEVDTDGVYFVPPPTVETEDDELAYIERLGEHLPPGIRLAHDGRFQAMLSLQLKNYALLDYGDHLTLKGSSLRSRRLEPCFRDFILQAARAFMTNNRAQARHLYFDLAERIRDRGLSITEISQWAMIHDQTLATQPRLKRLLARQPSAAKSGERMLIYERGDGELALSDEYGHDENLTYLLRRLNDTAGRFESLFDSSNDFSAFFPVLTTRTDLQQAKELKATTQLSLF